MLVLDGEPRQPLPCFGPVRCYSEDRRKDVQAPPQLATAKSGARVCRWVGRWALHPSSAGWLTMYSRGGCGLAGVLDTAI